MYNSDEFEQLALWIRNFIDREAKTMTSVNQETLRDIFFTSTQYEYNFWNSAYTLETW
jgi:thiaminase